MSVNDIEIPIEFEDYKKVIEYGAKKYAANNWLEQNGQKSSDKDMFASMLRHLASATKAELDPETGLDHLLHLATRALMVYTRRQRGLVHWDDLPTHEKVGWKHYPPRVTRPTEEK